MITVVAWPRSGAHWLKAMLEHALGEEVGHSHFWPDAEGEYVLVVRDPRDVFASHWRLYRNDNPDTELTELEYVDYFMKGKGLGDREWAVGWVAHTQKLMSLRGLHPFVYYEHLYRRPEETLIQVLSTLRGDVPQVRYIMEAVRETRGVRCDPSTLLVDQWMGQPGKWAHQLHPATVLAIEHYCGDLMKELGYAIA